VHGPEEKIVTRRKKRDLEVIADNFKQRYEQQGRFDVLLNKQQTLDALEALKILAPFEATLIDSAKIFVKWKNEQNASINLAEAFAKYGENLTKKRKTEKYIKDFTYTLELFSEFKSTLICDLKTEDFESVLDKQVSSSRDAHLRKLNAVINHAVKKQYIKANFLKPIELHGISCKDVIIYTNSQVKSIFRYACGNDLSYLPYFAILFFGGVRPEGCQKLNWADLTSDSRLHLPYTINKGNKDGLMVEINSTLKAWLEFYTMRDGKCVGAIFPHSEDVFRGFRKKMAKEIRKTYQEYRWIQDGARRNFTSAHARLFGEAETAKALGHVDIKMVRKHYKKNITKSDAEEYWNITPQSLGLLSNY
jgi:integrase